MYFEYQGVFHFQRFKQVLWVGSTICILSKVSWQNFPANLCNMCIAIAIAMLCNLRHPSYVDMCAAQMALSLLSSSSIRVDTYVVIVYT